MAFHQPCERTIDPLQALVDERLIHLADERVKSGLRADLRDARAHLAKADHADTLNSHRETSCAKRRQHMAGLARTISWCPNRVP